MTSPLPPRPRSPKNDTSVPGGVQRQPKRRGIALSCAECRRLKLKCSREFPCSNCVKKGCGAICPDGSLTTGKGNRFVLANTEALHEKINVLATRVRTLEDALLEAHKVNSPLPHPLLSQELLDLKRPLERERQDVPGPEADEKGEAEDNIDSLGSLSISHNGGRSVFFGTTANSWYLLQNEEGSDSDEHDDSLVVGEDGNGLPPLPLPDVPLEPADPAWLSHAFPFSPPVAREAEKMRAAMINQLPRRPTARALAEVYFKHAAWMYTPISEEDFYSTIFDIIYPPPESINNITNSLSPDPTSHHLPGTPHSPHLPQPPQSQITAHQLAILCLVLALGSLVDLEKQAHAPEAMQYYHYARVALSMESVLEEQTITGIQALLLMCHFMFLAEISGPRWAIMGMIVKMAQSIGLHRDSGKWKLDPEQTRKRRALFYELLTYDSWQSLTFGRPPSLSAAHVDSQFPDEVKADPSGNTEMSFSAWKHRFAAQCLSQVHDEAFGARTPRYKVLLQLSKKVREWPIPPSLQVPGFGANSKVGGPNASASAKGTANAGMKGTANAGMKVELEQPTVQLTMQRHIAFAIREITYFYMHRGFFAQAMEDSPADPLGSKWSESVLAAFQSATLFVSLIETLYSQHPQLTERMWFLFTHVFSCSIVLGSIAQKPQMAFSRSALSHLESACSLFQRVSDHVRAGKILPILLKLRDRAHMAHQANITMSPQGDAVPKLSFLSPNIKSENVELSALGGMTRLVSRRTSSSPSVSSPSPASHHSNHSSSPIISDTQPFVVPSSGIPSNWQPYTHIQNLNVNINMSDSYYANGLPGPASSMSDVLHQQDTSMMYQMAPPLHGGRQQQHHQPSRLQPFPPAQLHHPSHSPGPGHNMALDMQHNQHQTPPYFANDFGGGYNGGGTSYMMNTPSPEMMPPGHDPVDSWHNFVSQYKM